MGEDTQVFAAVVPDDVMLRIRVGDVLHSCFLLYLSVVSYVFGGDGLKGCYGIMSAFALPLPLFVSLSLGQNVLNKKMVKLSGSGSKEDDEENCGEKS
jgi:hypothetical protein